jgi:hypothetical protein
MRRQIQEALRVALLSMTADMPHAVTAGIAGFQSPMSYNNARSMMVRARTACTSLVWRVRGREGAGEGGCEGGVVRPTPGLAVL